MKNLVGALSLLVLLTSAFAQANEICELNEGQGLPANASLYLEHGVMIFNGVKFVNHTVRGRYETGHYFTSVNYPGLTVQFSASGHGTHMYGFDANNSLFSYDCRPAAQ